MVYPPPGRWSEATQLRLTEQHRATAWSLVPTQLWRLLDWPELESFDLSSLRTVGGGSAVWPPELLRRLEQRLPWVRPGLGLGYGMTETNGLGTSLSRDLTYSRPESVGQAAPTVRVDVRDPMTRAPLPEGQVGEIALHTAASFTEYWNNPEATRAVFDEEGWYHTGDYGTIRDGCLYLEGRRQDLIIRGGENISPVEIENRLFEHPGIVEAVVVGVDHPTLGQEVKAYVVPRVPGELSEADVVSWCSEVLAHFKVPAHVEFVAELPHNAAGKVVKGLLGQSPAVANFREE
jgi:acyl-CoA synthetase (AMP-forming)/AMP-acid ligase II